MVTEKFKKAQEKLVQSVQHPEQFINQLQEKNKNFLEQWQHALQSLPQEIIALQQENQKAVTSLGQKVQDAIKKQPVDYTHLQQAVLQYHTENFATNTKFLKDNWEKSQKLFSIYTE